ncbi:hypothetical protein JXL21_06550 [Candidatus Bathyarchaeota archaeon]|nr:hypothetical protein [Candidatus Bathyarchaeota archaeon]
MTWIRAGLKPTEDPKKVEEAITKLFGEIALDTDADEMTISAKLDGVEALSDFRNRIAQDRIRDTLKRVLTRWTDEDRLSFGLNRQAAYAGHVSLNLQGEDPMGPIQVNIEGDVEQVIRYLTDKR